MTPVQEARIEAMIAWHTARAIDCRGHPPERHHAAKVAALRALLEEVRRLRQRP